MQNNDCELMDGIPNGYTPGQTKYIIIVGTVMSGLGKGIFAGSLAKILQDRGLSVMPIKLEGYLNLDAGTLNPVRHGEVFVLDDGTECDMDLGNYEKMLDLDLTSDNFMTSGQIMANILERERSGGYLGRDVQVIPHVTNEIKRRLRSLALNSHADIVFVEIGGTVGDLENASYLEACRQLSVEEGSNNVCFVALTYVPSPATLGEQKSKPAQIGLRQLMALGIMPDIVAVRSAKKLSQTIREKLALFGGVSLDSVFGMHDVASSAFVPDMIRDAELDSAVLNMFGLKPSRFSHLFKLKRDVYAESLHAAHKSDHTVNIGIAGKYTSLRDAYASIIHAVEHSAVACGVNVSLNWIDTEDIESYTDASNVLDDMEIDGLIVPGGFGTRGSDGKIECIRYARQNNIPFLGLCYGFQLAVIEFARNVCGITDATSGEINPKAKNKIIDILPNQSERMGGTMRLGGENIMIQPNTMLAFLYGSKCRQRFRHRYQFSLSSSDILEKGGMIFPGMSEEFDCTKQMLELPGHIFFVATQGHPEFTSRPLNPDPMFHGLIEATLKGAKYA